MNMILQEALAQICEYSEAGITVRGTYVLPNKEPKDGERKLYLAIEATSEMAIQKAKKEITRLIKEELVRLVGYTFCSLNKLKWIGMCSISLISFHLSVSTLLFIFLCSI